jgi:hypothetical protein
MFFTPEFGALAPGCHFNSTEAFAWEGGGFREIRSPTAVCRRKEVRGSHFGKKMLTGQISGRL